MKKIFFIPGRGETLDLRYSKDFLKLIDKNSYKVIPIVLPFNKKYILSEDKSFSDLIEWAQKEIKKHKPTTEDMIVGFSIGALVAYVLASKIKFKKGLICSMTAILGQDTKNFTKIEKEFFTKDQLKELPKLEYKKPVTPITYFVASGDPKEMKQRPMKLHEMYGGAFISIGKWPHKFSGKYLEILNNFL